ncbi:MAG: hypothetical protein LLG00_09445 [Planctomycetaceae bacterium]|nr:hypothetical protein [Planctomycetaceae bacterium]
MSIWNKVLVGLIAVASLGFFYLATRTLKTHSAWHTRAVAQASQIAQLKTDSQNLQDGVTRDGAVEPGIRQIQLDLDRLLADRRRAWFGCPARVNNVNRGQGTADIALTVDKPSPHGIAARTVVYAFEDSNDRRRGQYLGEFVVEKVAGKQLSLRPAVGMTTREVEALAAARGTWSLYELMPRDNHEAFAGLSDAQLKSILPAGSASEYLKDGKPAAKADPKDRVVDGKYVRPLLDYDVLFRDQQQKRILLVDSIEAATRDKALAQESLALAKKQVEACARDVAKAKEELAVALAQRKLVSDYLAKFQETLGKVQAVIKQTLQGNQAKARRLATLQLQAVEQIDRRTRAMALSPSEKR